MTETRLLSVKTKPRCAEGLRLMKLTLDLYVIANQFDLFCYILSVLFSN